MSNPPAPAPAAPPPPSGGFPWIPVLLVTGAVIVGFSFIAAAVYFALPQGGPPAAAAPTALVSIPTVVPLSATAANPAVVAAAPTQVPPPTAIPTASSPMLNITQDANVRNGPGLNYPVLGGLTAGTTVTVIGRDSTAQWFVIAYGAGSSGQGWVSSLVASYTGDANSLPVITAPPPPPPTNTAPPPPPTNTPAPVGYNSQGIIGDKFSVDKTVVGLNQDLWFRFKVHNSTGSPVSYAVLSIHADNGPSGQSWTNASIGPSGVVDWSDHINISTAGTYNFYLGICYGDKNACLANAAPWDRLSGSVTVTIQ